MTDKKRDESVSVYVLAKKNGTLITTDLGKNFDGMRIGRMIHASTENIGPRWVKYVPRAELERLAFELTGTEQVLLRAIEIIFAIKEKDASTRHFIRALPDRFR